jgi:uncharacterized protein (DUF2252 family)
MSSRKALRPADRVSALKLQQTLKMARSAHAYVRGSTVKFYEWLKDQKRGSLPEGPPVTRCFGRQKRANYCAEYHPPTLYAAPQRRFSGLPNL